ncbi:MAG: hypothetical protein LBH92_05210, partial [Bacteroidales bacterium]|nr:hypothetical protein [Bacteroidales bacterium]
MAGRFDSLAIFVDNNSFSFGAKCHEAVREMYEIASHDADSIHLISRCFYAEATLSFVQGISDSTLIVRLESYLEQIDKEKRPYDYALLLCSLGLFQDALGNYAEAFLNAIKALEIFRKTSDKMFIPKTLNLLGNISGHINILTMAEDYYHEALSLTDPNHLDYYRIKSNIYRLYYSKQEPQRAIDSLKTFTPIIKKKGDQGLLAINYLNLATFYFNISGYDSTYCYSIKAREILETIDNERLTAIMNHNLGIFYYFKEQDYKTALYYLRKAKEGAKEQKNHNHLYSIYYIMAHTFAGLDQYDSAFYYF